MKKILKNTVLKIIRFYQVFISPSLGNNCRFSPNCSQYCYLVIEKYGVGRGLWRGLKRILRCHPWNEGGEDLP
ncbi:membrane protein insertion efficiency factor YidD [Patescibacteria group bacterium]|nr:membrane protein insertion efficiency factor YidD [Patescibacteria group bacterium]